MSMKMLVLEKPPKTNKRWNDNWKLSVDGERSKREENDSVMEVSYANLSNATCNSEDEEIQIRQQK
jgi:hypothetical protein